MFVHTPEANRCHAERLGEPCERVVQFKVSPVFLKEWKDRIFGTVFLANPADILLNPVHNPVFDTGDVVFIPRSQARLCNDAKIRRVRSRIIARFLVIMLACRSSFLDGCVIMV